MDAEGAHPVIAPGSAPRDPARKAALLHAWGCGLSVEEIELDRRWREAFGGPLPILGDPKTVRKILARNSRAE